MHSTMLSLICLVTLLTCVLGGSVCPSRRDIYPCTCANVPLRKNHVSTIVTCYRLGDSDSLNAIFPALRSMDIDQFYLYDSFWDAHQLGAAGEAQRVLPLDWLNIREIEIVDTTLSSCFACQLKLNCRNTETTKFKVTNSSSAEKICTLCDTGKGNKYSWIACMPKLKEFHFNHGKLTSLDVAFFPKVMRDLVTLDLAYNQISKVDSKAWVKLPALASIDLSHNALDFLDDIFTNPLPELKFLDVSFNFIKEIGAEVFSSLPQLTSFNADSNAIADLKEDDWKNIPSSLKNVYLNSNPIDCGCSIRWVISTLKNVTVSGKCASPSNYKNSHLKVSSSALVKKCDENGNLRTRKSSSSTTPRTRTF